MKNTTPETRSVVVERELAYPPEKIWRALTQPHLIAEWLLQNDFTPVLNHKFKLNASWGEIDCQVLTIEPEKTLTYTWQADGLESVVKWTLSPSASGTLLRMEQTGFNPEKQKLAYFGARSGWPRFFDQLEQLLSQVD
ncbi:SRPBCC family protein [Thalassospira lucentensis]|uniref:SRPBCC family protein n=1 Tax=Thalassospira lucentensis TaxID=168935 RepID=UPI00399D5F81